MAIERSSVVKWLVILAVLGGLAWAGTKYWKNSSSATLEFKTNAVVRGDITQSVTASGTLTPVRMVEVGSQISGIITEIKADFNSYVKSNDVVAQIDPATYERALRQAEAELANAKAAHELAQLNYDRGVELYDSKLIPKSDFDQLRVNLSQANATVMMRRENVERAKVDLSRTTIYAPLDGVIISRKVDAGQTVAASMNAPTLFIIANDLSKMRIEAAVSEADVGGVAEGQPVQFNVDAFPGRVFQGQVEQVRFGATTNQSVVTYTTIVTLDNKDLKLRPGMTANAKIITSERKGVLKIPNAAIRFRPPVGVVVKGDTNSPAAKPSGSVALIETGPFAGLPEMPWMKGGERRRPTDAERDAYMASLSPDQKQKYEQIMAQMRARFSQGGGPGEGGGGGGFGGGGGERRSAETEVPQNATVYLLEKEKLPTGGEQTVLKPVMVKLGISDGANVEVLSGLKEGELLVTGTVSPNAVASTATRNLLGGPFGGPPRR